jgi:hypothetical protein
LCDDLEPVVRVCADLSGIQLMRPTARQHIHSVIAAIEGANTEGPSWQPDKDVLDGLSGSKTVGALQRLAALFANEADTCYLEVGVFQGLTLLSVAGAVPTMPCFGIDNFSILDPEGRNLEVVRDRMARLGSGNAKLINLDFQDALLSLGDHIGASRIGAYFVDGAHDYRSQLIGLLFALPYLHDNAVIVIDDANYAFVRQSTHDFLVSHPDFKMVFEAYSPAHPANMDAATLVRWESDWLNGVNILVRDPDGLLPEMLPPVDANRDLYVNDWLVHRHGLAELAPEALALADAVCRGGSSNEVEAHETLRRQFADVKAQLTGRFLDRNVYSDRLTSGTFNRLRLG